VIWPENYDPKTSTIYALNDIAVKPMKIRIIITATSAALASSMAGRSAPRRGAHISKFLCSRTADTDRRGWPQSSNRIERTTDVRASALKA
jgi:hypothetical protein